MRKQSLLQEGPLKHDPLEYLMAVSQFTTRVKAEHRPLPNSHPWRNPPPIASSTHSHGHTHFYCPLTLALLIYTYLVHGEGRGRGTPYINTQKAKTETINILFFLVSITLSFAYTDGLIYDSYSITCLDLIFPRI